MQQHVMTFLREEDGATAIEYGLIAGLVAVGIIVALTALGTNLSGLFTGISGKLSGAATKAAAS